MYLVSKEDKKLIKGWAMDLQGKSEWMVIQFVAPEQKRLSVIPFYDKSKLDVPKDRYFQVQKKMEGSEEWMDAMKRLGECLRHSFQRQIREYKVNIATLLQRQNIPGWNFCNFFVVSEGLAFTMIQCGQYEEALNHYTSLKDIYLPLPGKFNDKNE